MALYRVATGQFINASDIDQLVDVLQRPSGGQETGKYFLTDNAYASGAFLGEYVSSISRGATPVSVNIDTSDQAPTNCATAATDHLTSSGFRVYTTASNTTTTVIVGGNYTILY